MPKVHRELAPIWALPDMFSDMTRKALLHGLREALQSFGGRPIIIATMCSGTESPIFALELITEALKSMDLKFKFVHKFSAEIVPFKQAFIQRNFNPPIFFRDVSQIKFGQKAQTVFGADASPPPPGEVQILVAGFACVDFSNLNSKKRSFEFDQDRDPQVAEGESGVTFRAIYEYARDYRPDVIIIENIINVTWDLLVEEWKKIEYAATYIKVDTKDYYIPQTRRRGYMICINHQPKTSAIDESQAWDGTKKWAKTLEVLKRPASSTVENFLLKRNSQELKSSLAEQAAQCKANRSRDTGWPKSQQRHSRYRKQHGLGGGNPYTFWKTMNPKYPAYTHVPWMKAQPERIQDALDICKLDAAQSQRDFEYKAVIMDLSQNLDRGIDKTPPGLSGCITPSGIPFSTVLGRPLVGKELLSLQGLPMDRVHLTTETESNLRDLAGNAMTSTVIGAALLSAFAALPHALQFSSTVDHSNDDAASTPMQNAPEDAVKMLSSKNTTGIGLASSCHFGSSTNSTVADMIRLAGQTVQYCPCESEDGISRAVIMRCSECSITVCKECSGNPKHSLTPLILQRLEPKVFHEAVFRMLPTRLHVNLPPEAFEAAGSHEYYRQDDLAKQLRQNLQQCLSEEMRLRSWQRGTSWAVTYSSSRLRLMLQLDGLQAEWRLFARPSNSEPGNSALSILLQNPIARMRLEVDAPDVLTGRWEISLPHIREREISVSGSGQLVPSWQNELGLLEFAGDNVWDSLVIDGSEVDCEDPRMNIDGCFQYLPQCGTANGFLHRHTSKKSASDKDLFLMFLPRTYNDGTDTMVSTPNIEVLEPGEYREVYGSFYIEATPESQDEVVKGKIPDKSSNGTELDSWIPSSTSNQRILYRIFGEWVPCPSAALSVPSSTEGIKKIALLESPKATLTEKCSSHAIQILKCEFPWTERNPIGTSQLGNWVITENNVHHMSIDLKWLIDRISQICKGGVSPWTPCHVGETGMSCETCAPRRPEIHWKLNEKGGSMVPYENALQASNFEKAWKMRPSPIIIKISTNEVDNGAYPLGSLEISLNVKSLMHRALGNIPRTANAGSIETTWRLDVNHNSHEIPVAPKYRLISNKTDDPHFFTFAGTKGPDGRPYRLRIEQARSLSWMLQRDSLLAPSFQEEVLEECPNSILNWNLEAKISRSRSIRGGLIADEVGYGKTVLVIALVKATLYNAVFESVRSSRDVGSNGTLIPIKATCIIAPSSLVGQWQSEIQKFWPNCNLATISKMDDLIPYTISDMKEAEIVLVSADLLCQDQYLNRFAELASLPTTGCSTSRETKKSREFGAWLSTALERLMENTQKLLRDGTSGFVKFLDGKYQEYKGDWSIHDKKQSKRFRGQQFQDHQAASKERASVDQVEDETTPSSPKDIDGFDVEVPADASGVILNMFRFHRIVVDELTYITSVQMRAIKAVKSLSTWIISATPSKEDFSDVQHLASFLGIYLGSEDTAKAVTSHRNRQLIHAERTRFEVFEALQSEHTASWYRFRDGAAQNFLDTFARQNPVEYVEIPVVHHYVPIRLDAVHRISYAILQALIFRGNPWLPKEGRLYGEKKDDQGKVCERKAYFQRLLTIDPKKVPVHVALCRLACYDPWTDDYNHSSHEAQASGLLHIFKEVETEIARQLGQEAASLAAKRKLICDDNAERLYELIQSVKENAYGEMEISAIITRSMRTTNIQTPTQAFFELVEEKPSVVTQCPWNAMTNFLRQKIGNVNEHALALRRAKRARRALETALRLQQLVASREFRFRCDCGCLIGEVFELKFTTHCGHTFCTSCSLRSGGKCCIEECDAYLHDHFMVTPYQLGFHAPVTTAHGAKVEAVVRLIKRTAEDDQVLVFSQFKPTTDKISEALKAANIAHFAIQHAGKSPMKISRVQQQVAAFKSNTQSEGFIKALVLDPTDETAAGHNFTNASTVIFISPLITSSDEAYHNTREQAIGRVKRFGQTKTVHVYDLVALHTWEVDFMEHCYNVKLQLLHGPGWEILTPAMSLDAYRNLTSQARSGWAELGSPVYRDAVLGIK